MPNSEHDIEQSGRLAIANEYQRRAQRIHETVLDSASIENIAQKIEGAVRGELPLDEVRKLVSTTDAALWKGSMSFSVLGITCEMWRMICVSYSMYSYYMHFAVPEMFGFSSSDYRELDVPRHSEARVQIHTVRNMGDDYIPTVNMTAHLLTPRSLPRRLDTFSGHVVGNRHKNPAQFLKGLERLATIELETIHDVSDATLLN